MDYDFKPMFSKWTSCDPFDLFEAEIVCKVKDDAKTIAENLKTEAARAQMLMIWTDCDREGENIGAEIAKICRKAKADITVRRARFSAIIAQYVPLARPLSADLVSAATDRSIMLHNIPCNSTWPRRTLSKPVSCLTSGSVRHSLVSRP